MCVCVPFSDENSGCPKWINGSVKRSSKWANVHKSDVFAKWLKITPHSDQFFSLPFSLLSSSFGLSFVAYGMHRRRSRVCVRSLASVCVCKYVTMWCAYTLTCFARYGALWVWWKRLNEIEESQVVLHTLAANVCARVLPVYFYSYLFHTLI